MENNRKRIIELVKKNIVTKIAHKNNATDVEQKNSLLKEIERNKSLFLHSDKDMEEAKAKKEFILDILRQLGWSLDFADELVNDVAPMGEKITISQEKMTAYSNLYKLEKYKLKKEIGEIIYSDTLNGNFKTLYSRLDETEAVKGTTWGKEEIDFIIDKRDKGYSFKAIAKVLKRPDRVVRLKYHANK